MLSHNGSVLNASLAATYYTPWFRTGAFSSFHIHASGNGTGTLVGAFTIEESSDPLVEHEIRQGVAPASSAAKKVDISASDRVAIDGEFAAVSGAHEACVTVLTPGCYLRLKFTNTSGGVGSLANFWTNGKV